MLDRMKLLRDKVYPVSDKINIKLYTLNEIYDIGFDVYDEHLSILLMRNYDIADILYFDYNIWYEDVTPFEVLLKNKMWKEALEFFTGIDNLILATEDEGAKYISNYTPNIKSEDLIIIDEEILLKIQNIIRVIHYRKKEKHDLDSKKTSKFVKIKIIERQKYDRTKDKKKRFKPKIDLSSMIIALTWRAESAGIDIWNLNMWELHTGFYQVTQNDKYQKTVSALLNGKLDKKKVNLNNEFWANILK